MCEEKAKDWEVCIVLCQLKSTYLLSHHYIMCLFKFRGNVKQVNDANGTAKIFVLDRYGLVWVSE